MHQLTDLADRPDDLGTEVLAANARIRIEGTDNLLAAAATVAHLLSPTGICTITD